MLFVMNSFSINITEFLYIIAFFTLFVSILINRAEIKRNRLPIPVCTGTQPFFCAK